MTTVAITYCVASTLQWVASDEFKKTSKDAREELDGLRKDREKIRKTKEQSEHWKKQHAHLAKSPAAGAPSTSQSDPVESDIAHLTIPIWFRKRKRKMYCPQDREWQDAAKVISDEKKVMELRTKAAQMVVVAVENNPQTRQWLTWIQFKAIAHADLELAPVLFPPTTYEVPCIFVKSDQIEFGWRPLSAASGARIERTFHPVIFARAFYAGFKAFTFTSYTITASRLKSTFSTPSELRVEITAKRDAAAVQPAPPQDKKRTGIAPRDQKPSPTPVLSESNGSLVPHHFFTWKAHQARAQSMTYQAALDNARKVFKQQFVTKQSMALQEQTPGLVLVVGTVKFIGDRGTYRTNVSAYYSPSENAFVGSPRVTGALIIPGPSLSKWNDAPKSKTSPPMAMASKPQANSKPDKSPVQQDPSEGTTRPSPEGKDAGK